jgi:uncharacterized membrane protein YkvA (DUF1232 family)
MTGVPRLVLRLMGDRRVPYRLKLLIPAAIVYLVSPIDLVPDILPALGHIDDVVVVILSVAVFLAMAPRDVVLEHLRGTRNGSGRGTVDEKGGQAKSTVIEGSYRVVEDEGEPDR